LIAIGDDGIADQDSFVGLELDLECHQPLLSVPLKRKWRLREANAILEFDAERRRPAVTGRTGGSATGTAAAPPDWLAKPARVPWSTVVAAFAGPAGLRPLRWCRRA